MTDIMRQVTEKERLPIKPCPFCGGNIIAGDCGYSTFNPGFARCEGKCKREFKLGYVDNRWEAGLRWNEYAPKAVNIEEAEKKLKQLRGE